MPRIAVWRVSKPRPLMMSVPGERWRVSLKLCRPRDDSRGRTKVRDATITSMLAEVPCQPACAKVKTSRATHGILPVTPMKKKSQVLMSAKASFICSILNVRFSMPVCSVGSGCQSGEWGVRQRRQRSTYLVSTQAGDSHQPLVARQPPRRRRRAWKEDQKADSPGRACSSDDEESGGGSIG